MPSIPSSTSKRLIPGYLLCQDTCFAGTIEGVGKIHLQSVLDAQGSLAFARLALSKAPMTVLDTL